MKRIITIVSVLYIILLQSLAGDTICIDNICYLLQDNRTAKVVGTKKEFEEIKIPSTIKYEQKSYKVVEIGFRAFWGSSPDIKKVSLPNTITCIDEGAFLLCVDLESINIPKSVRTIGKEAFS